jgi:hypothetical protein
VEPRITRDAKGNRDISDKGRVRVVTAWSVGRRVAHHLSGDDTVMKKSEMKAALDRIAELNAKMLLVNEKSAKALAPLEAEFQSARKKVTAKLEKQWAALSEERSALEKKLSDAMVKGAILNFKSDLGHEALIKQTTQRSVSPENLLALAGTKRELAWSCMQVQIGAAEKAFGKDAVDRIAVNVPKGGPKLEINFAKPVIGE